MLLINLYQFEHSSCSEKFLGAKKLKTFCWLQLTALVVDCQCISTQLKISNLVSRFRVELLMFVFILFRSNCANLRANQNGGWWYDACFRASLNNPWGISVGRWTNIIWYTWRGSEEALKATKMMLRCD